MSKFMLLVDGSEYTSYVHNSIDNAVAEAKRLFEKTGKEVHILEIVGSIKMEEIPVTRKEMVVHLPDRLKNDGLPF